MAQVRSPEALSALPPPDTDRALPIPPAAAGMGLDPPRVWVPAVAPASEPIRTPSLSAEQHKAFVCSLPQGHPVEPEADAAWLGSG